MAVFYRNSIKTRLPDKMQEEFMLEKAIIACVVNYKVLNWKGVV
ncbi:hypothetical protein [Clostridium tagluense]|nr:hypothetical protein [Clostridium tagluense]